MTPSSLRSAPVCLRVKGPFACITRAGGTPRLEVTNIRTPLTPTNAQNWLASARVCGHLLPTQKRS